MSLINIDDKMYQTIVNLFIAQDSLEKLFGRYKVGPDPENSGLLNINDLMLLSGIVDRLRVLEEAGVEVLISQGIAKSSADAIFNDFLGKRKPVIRAFLK